MIVIVGGGLAGSACAIALAQAGRAVTLIEREAGPVHKICGEFLSPEAQAYLLRLGLDLPALGGHVISRLRLVRGGGCITTDLPFQGLGLTRRALDEALLDLAGRSAVAVRRGRAVRRISPGPLAVEIDQSETLHPETLLLASGKHEVRGAPRRAAPGPLVGFKTYFRLAPAQRQALAGHIELILLRGGYAGLQSVEDGSANLCLLVDARALQQAGGNWAGLLDWLQAQSPHLAARLAGAQALLAAPLSIARVPYGFRHRPAPGDAPGLFRLGDQAAVIPSFTGDGMAIALHSAALAARAVAAGAPAASYQRQLRADLGGQIRRAAALQAGLSAPLLGPALFAAARAWPASLGLAAAWTRVAGAALPG